MPVLRLVKGPGAPKEFTLDDAELSPESFSVMIGRDERVCSIHLSHPCVSRRHARVVTGDQGLALTDEESKSGTFLNGVRLKPHAAHSLRHRDRIEICGYAFVYYDEASGSARGVSDEDTGSPEPERVMKSTRGPSFSFSKISAITASGGACSARWIVFCVVRPSWQ